MSVGETDADHPRFFVGCDDGEGDELLDPGRHVGYDCLYENVEEEEDEDEEYDSPPERQIVVGICAMSKKSKSKPMKEILERLCLFKYITVVIFEEDVILNEPVENWPLCDCLISFHSKGFPLDKAVAYENLRNPFVINDLDLQYCIQDRREVYRILKAEGIQLPRYAVLNRDPARPEECSLVEGEDHVEVNGEVFQKPFVEKPVSAEDHNVYIYYPTSAGGGSQRLFRKIGSRSSVYSPESNVRKTGSYIYEEFMPTDGTDVKVYTVGPDYAHAEARKSPALDGKVERDSEGKEVRYPVILNAREKLIAWKVCQAFKQTVCGFDLLRANGQSYVCDVNGFSFVKNSMKYYDDCAKILGNIIMRELAPQFHIPWSIPLEAEDIPIVPTTSGTMMELRCVIAVIRHGDRTPKQKMKMEVRHQRFFDLFEKCDGYKTGKLKLKKPKQLQEVLDIARQLLAELGQNNDSEIEESKAKLEQLKTVLEMYGHFSGINRKVQLTYLPHGCPKTSSEEEDVRRDDPSLLLVLKWGGELTPAGRVQAEELGRAFRCMYPGGQGDYAGFPGCGLLRLHSTYRHDLKIYASDEGRVQMTAAAFAKGLLALEGELTPILVQMVKSANMNGLLDSDSDSLSSCQQRVKARLHEILQRDRDFMAEDYDKLTPTSSVSLVKSMQMIKNPVKTCDKVYSLIQSLTLQIRQRMEDPKSADIQLYHSETLELMLRRWAKLEKDFKMKNGRYNISKIPDIYDCIKYDVQHNSSLKLDNTMEIYRLSKALADIVIPQEYGISQPEKLDIAKGYCTPLIRKIRSDLQRTQDDDTVNKLHPVYSRGVMSPERHVRTRLYFTSESHVHSLLSILRYGALCDETKDEQWKRAMDYLKVVSELNYMTQIVIMLYEDPNKDPSSEERFHVELHFSPGAKGCEDDKNLPSGFGYRPASRENEGSKKKSQNDSDEESSAVKRDEPDRALMMFRPLVSDPIYIHRKSPLPRSKKIGSVESPLQTDFNKSPASKEESPLSVSSPDSIGTWIHYTCGVGTGRRRRRSGEQKPSSPVSPKSLAFTSSIFGSWQQVLSESSGHTRSGRLHPEHKLAGGIGSHCAGLFSTMVLGGSSSAPNLQDYARAHRKKLTSAAFLDGFELYSMVPSICPLETLHNSLSLKQVDDFLASIAMSQECNMVTPTSSPASALICGAGPVRNVPLNTYTPARVLPCPYTHASSVKRSLETEATDADSGSPSRGPGSGSADNSPHGPVGDRVVHQYSTRQTPRDRDAQRCVGETMANKTFLQDSTSHVLANKIPLQDSMPRALPNKIPMQDSVPRALPSKIPLQDSMPHALVNKIPLQDSVPHTLVNMTSQQDTTRHNLAKKTPLQTTYDTVGNQMLLQDSNVYTLDSRNPLQDSITHTLGDKTPLQSSIHHNLGSQTPLQPSTHDTLSNQSPLQDTTPHTLGIKTPLQPSTHESLCNKTFLQHSSHDTSGNKFTLLPSVHDIMGNKAILQPTVQGAPGIKMQSLGRSTTAMHDTSVDKVASQHSSQDSPGGRRSQQVLPHGTLAENMISKDRPDGATGDGDAAREVSSLASQKDEGPLHSAIKTQESHRAQSKKP
ncbi:inositol hexakisphosphate and diphosphoinositol-pentakisphosphate kinase 2 isoform X4 [Brienomyrus brachyistius]|uniref:inositol hexakisphosphate and diphosphoinositol-pentakisphosphate kinase 2 isoform X4 n=1 Tax=Brienomyrus brachyistius TaxID=42636 RepID=UPI0020B38E17|nr:inositol hexakisphosphate and diphosphoinositol-pentakisphosphate kinase 2 isoform X4 [Brienomyrus brachyistius]